MRHRGTLRKNRHLPLLLLLLVFPSTYGTNVPLKTAAEWRRDIQMRAGCDDSTLSSATDQCRAHVMARVEDIAKGSTVRIAGARGGRDTNRLPSPAVLPTKGTAAYCLEVIGRYNAGENSTGTCQKWQESVEDLYMGNFMWTKFWGSEDIVGAAFGSRDALVAAIVGAISAATMNITDFGIQANSIRRKWVRDSHDSIDKYQRERSAGNAISLMLLAGCYPPAVSVLCESMLLATTIADVYLQCQADKDLMTLESMFSHGISSFLSEGGRHVRGMMDLLQTTAVMAELKDPVWNYAGKMLMFYVTTAIASNVTYTADDVYSDLDRMQIAIPKLDAYVNAFSDDAFNKSTFQGVDSKIALSRTKFIIDLVIVPALIAKWGNRYKNVLPEERRVYEKFVREYQADGLRLVFNDRFISNGGFRSVERQVRADRAILDRVLGELDSSATVRDMMTVEILDEELIPLGLEEAVDNNWIILRRGGGGIRYTINPEGLRMVRQTLLRRREEIRSVLGEIKILQKGPPHLLKQTSLEKGIGYGMAALAVAASLWDQANLATTVRELRESVTLMAINDVQTTSVIMDTVRAWQAVHVYMQPNIL